MGDLSDEAFAVYVALRNIYRQDEPKCYVSLNMIYYALCGKLGNYKTDRRFMDKIRNGLNELVDTDLVSYIEVAKSEFVLDLSNLNLDTKNAKKTKKFFAIIDNSEIRTIMNSDSQHRFKLLRYFVYLAGTFNSESKAGFTSIDKMVKHLHFAKQSIINYTTILQEMELIYTYHSDSFIRYSDGGKITKISNTYGRYRDKDKVISAGESQANRYGYDSDAKKVRTKSTKEIRSASAKFYSFCSGKKYDDDTLREIYLTLVEFNKDKPDEYKKDLAIFKNYDFYCEEEVDTKDDNYLDDDTWGESDPTE